MLCVSCVVIMLVLSSYYRMFFMCVVFCWCRCVFIVSVMMVFSSRVSGLMVSNYGLRFMLCCLCVCGCVV